MLLVRVLVNCQKINGCISLAITARASRIQALVTVCDQYAIKCMHFLTLKIKAEYINNNFMLLA